MGVQLLRVLMMARNLVTDLSGPRYATEVARELAKSKNEVFIPTSNAKVHIENARILKLPAVLGKKPVSTVVYSIYGKVIKKKYDISIVHGNGYTFLDDITTVHFMSRAFDKQTTHFGIMGNSPKTARAMVEKVILRSSKHLIAVSSLVERDLIELYNVPKEYITTIHNGVTLDEFSLPVGNEKENERVRALNEYGFETDKKLLLFVGGGAYQRKGFRFLVEALPHISKDVVIVAICKNLSEMNHRLLSKIDVDHRVKIVNYIPDISQIYRAADIYVLPTIYDPFPLAVLEAMASGLPTIVSSCTGITDIIENGKNGLVVKDPSDVVELANAINFLAENSKKRRSMGLNARSTVEELSWKNVTKKILGLYETISRR